MEVNIEDQKRYHEFKAEQDKRIKEIYDACNKKLQKINKKYNVYKEERLKQNNELMNMINNLNKIDVSDISSKIDKLDKIFLKIEEIYFKHCIFENDDD